MNVPDPILDFAFGSKRRALAINAGVWVLIGLALFSCVGCSTVGRPEPVVETVTVDAPVARSCVPPALGEAPAYIDTDAALKAAGGPEDRYQMVIAGRVQRNARLGEAEPVIRGCR